MTAGIFVDYLGNGVLEEIIHPTLQLCYMQNKILVPQIAGSNNRYASYRFTLPADLTNPFMYCTVGNNIEYYFKKVDSTTWDIFFVGKRFLDTATGSTSYSTSLPMIVASTTYIYYGGYRG